MRQCWGHQELKIKFRKSCFTRAFKNLCLFQVLEISDSKKLLAIYNDLSARLRTVIDVELPLLQKVVDERMAVETAHRQLTASNESPVNGETLHTGSLTIPHSKFGYSSSAGGSPDSASTLRLHPLHQWNGDSNNNNNNNNTNAVNGMRKISSVSSAFEQLAMIPTRQVPVASVNSTGGSEREGSGQFRSRTNSLHVPKSLLVRPKLLWKVSPCFSTKIK